MGDHLDVTIARVTIARDGIRYDTVEYINSWRRAALSDDFRHIDFAEVMPVFEALDAFEELLYHKLQQLPPLPILTMDDITDLSEELLQITEIFELFADRILIRLSVADANDLVLEGDFDFLNIRDSRFLFTYRGVPWLPDVTHLSEPFCWALCVSQLLRATYSFQQFRLGPALSMQCIINGVPNYAADGDMNNINNVLGVYEATTWIALKFVQKRGCALDAHVPYVRHRQVEIPYLRIAEIQEDPFSIHPDSSIHSIRVAMEDFGCLVGAFECDDTFELYLGPPNVYFIAPAEVGVNRPLHYALICGVGSLDDADDGTPFLQIQNSFGANWGDGGYGYIAKDLFHHIHGLRGGYTFQRVRELSSTLSSAPTKSLLHRVQRGS